MIPEKLTLYGSVVADAERLFGISAEEIFWRQRYPRIVRARQWIWMTLHDKHNWSYPEIGRAMDYDHSTVFLGARKARKRHEALTNATTQGTDAPDGYAAEQANESLAI